VAYAAQMLPFRSSMGFPLEIMLNRLSGGEIALGFAVASAWIVAFGLLYRLGWRIGLRRYQAVGG
ncbi:MAG: ABC-2 family transporter protein, partial [Acidimicrobiia bacterium]